MTEKLVKESQSRAASPLFALAGVRAPQYVLSTTLREHTGLYLRFLCDAHVDFVLLLMNSTHVPLWFYHGEPRVHPTLRSKLLLTMADVRHREGRGPGFESLWGQFTIL